MKETNYHKIRRIRNGSDIEEAREKLIKLLEVKFDFHKK